MLMTIAGVCVSDLCFAFQTHMSASKATVVCINTMRISYWIWKAPTRVGRKCMDDPWGASRSDFWVVWVSYMDVCQGESRAIWKIPQTILKLHGWVLGGSWAIWNLDWFLCSTHVFKIKSFNDACFQIWGVFFFAWSTLYQQAQVQKSFVLDFLQTEFLPLGRGEGHVVGTCEFFSVASEPVLLRCCLDATPGANALPGWTSHGARFRVWGCPCMYVCLYVCMIMMTTSEWFPLLAIVPVGVTIHWILRTVMMYVCMYVRMYDYEQ